MVPPVEFDCPDIDPVRQFLQTSIKLKAEGDPYNYNHVVKQLRSKDDPETLCKVYIGLSSCVSQITQKPVVFQEILNAIFHNKWDENTTITSAFIYLVLKIVSANTVFLVPSLKLFVSSFIVVSTVHDVKAIHSQVHGALESILVLIPNGRSEIFSILTATFPHQRFPKNILCQYVQQLLTICNYVPVLQQRIIGLIISKCLQLDVEIVIEDTGEVMIQGETDGDEDMFPIEDCILNNSKSAEESSQRIAEAVAEMADKLDGILSILCQHVLELFPKSELTTDIVDCMTGPGHRMFEHLLQAFEDSILMTYKSKFVQFVIFICCARSSQASLTFTRRLYHMFASTDVSPLKRQAAAIYLGSFLARGKFLDLKIVSATLSEMIAWADNYVASVTNSCPYASDAPSEGQLTMLQLDEFGRQLATRTSGADGLQQHETFFMCVQAICYALCFHGTVLALKLRQDEVTRSRLDRVMSCDMLPIRFCLESVREEFMRLCGHTDLLSSDCLNKLPPEILELLALHSAGHSQRVIGRGVNPLETFFPFDPCLLTSVGGLLDECLCYRAWRGLPGVDIECDVSALQDQNLSVADREDDTDSQDGVSVSLGVDSTGRSQLSSSSVCASYSSEVDRAAVQELGSSFAYSQTPNNESLVSSGSEMMEGSWRDQSLLAQSIGDGSGKRERQFSITSAGSW